MTDQVIIYCTCPDDDAVANNIAEQLVSTRLAACVNILPGVRSVYIWQGQIAQDNEKLLLIKTRRELYPKLEAKIKALHPYELPEIVMVSLDAGLPGYLNWINQSTS
jgi:periplasmic divalent cation tolerance protein